VACSSTIVILDAHVPFMEPAEFERAEVDVPDAIVDFFQAYVLSAQAEVLSAEWAAA